MNIEFTVIVKITGIISLVYSVAKFLCAFFAPIYFFFDSKAIWSQEIVDLMKNIKFDFELNAFAFRQKYGFEITDYYFFDGSIYFVVGWMLLFAI